MKTCPTCSAAAHELATFCPSCGGEFHGSAAIPRASSPPAPQRPVNPWMWVIGGGVMLFLVIGYFAAVQVAMSIQQGPAAAIAVPATAAGPTSSVSPFLQESYLPQIGLALHNYHDVHQMFPPSGIFDEEGTEFHSWQTALLPFLQHADIYEDVQQNLPWNAPENQWAFSETIREYLNPDIGLTMTDKGYALSHYAGNSKFFKENTGTPINQITDGTSNTIMAGEIMDGFPPWAYPRNVRDPAAGIKGDNLTFGGPRGDGAFFLNADGTVVFISDSVDPKVLEALSTPAGGEPTPEVPKARISPRDPY